VRAVSRRPDHRDVPVSDRIGVVAGVRRHARAQFRAWLLLHGGRLPRLAGRAMARADAGQLLARNPRCGVRCRPARRVDRTLATPPYLWTGRALPATAHLCAGVDTW